MIAPSAMHIDPHPGKTDTSAAAAEKIKRKAPSRRNLCLVSLQVIGDMTPDEIIRIVFNDDVNPYSIRPRLTELVRLGFARDSGKRRKNRQGNDEIVYTVKPAP